ncbi:unnamed protein product [Ceratitis capitata]|uniref:(Mediterranean fruit fly) hypothetical protein n=1 Tax=Ceratitis capitata TaxID=7213 RepID=A0A811V2J8_CERCA|nr:unnamed protein product [Ceratitis capitata]
MPTWMGNAKPIITTPTEIIAQMMITPTADGAAAAVTVRARTDDSNEHYESTQRLYCNTAGDYVKTCPHTRALMLVMDCNQLRNVIILHIDEET